MTGILTYFYWRTITDEDIEEINSKSKKKIDSKYRVGDKIKAKAIGWQRFYGGKVTKVSKNKNGMVVYEVKFEDGEVQKNLKKTNSIIVKLKKMIKNVYQTCASIVYYVLNVHHSYLKVEGRKDIGYAVCI